MTMMTLDNRGVALVTLIIVLAVFGTIALSVQVMIGQSAVSGVVELERARALYLAEAGVNDSFWELKYSGKLYGPPEQDFGVIDARSVSFESGVSAYYLSADSAEVIYGRGSVNGLERDVAVGIVSGSASTEYLLYQISNGGLSIGSRATLSGSVFCRGDFMIMTPTGTDPAYLEIFVGPGGSAYYADGSPLDHTELDPVPSPPVFATSIYDALIARAADTGLSGPLNWGDTELGDTVFIDGSLSLKHHGDLTKEGSYSVLVVSGNISISHHCTVEDDIFIIAGGNISINGTSTRIGDTTGRSGNVLYSSTGTVTIGANAVANGTILTPFRCTLEERSEFNGLIYAGDRVSVSDRVTFNGAIWTEEFSSGEIGERCNISENQSYLPASMPMGLTAPGGGGEGETSFAGRWWELRGQG
ncbi:MAG: type II secretion system GspH family protein [Bacteroidales bacterium]|nr:type II secretion system GspH family protein [Candidatus Latescibacterota bacterium]